MSPAETKPALMRELSQAAAMQAAAEGMEKHQAAKQAARKASEDQAMTIVTVAMSVFAMMALVMLVAITFEDKAFAALQVFADVLPSPARSYLESCVPALAPPAPAPPPKFLGIF